MSKGPGGAAASEHLSAAGAMGAAHARPEAPSAAIPAVPAVQAFPAPGSGSGPISVGAQAPVSRITVLPKSCPTCQARYPADFRVCPRDASPLVDAGDDGTDPLLGVTLGDAYQIVRIIGEGGMGRVYEARHTRLGNKRFAVKMLHAEYARQVDVVARFQREAEAASGIDHPNVVDVYDVHHTDSGRPYLVGEFLEGEEFGDFLERTNKISAPLAVRIVRQICDALGAAHARGVIHRDMKPENVFLVGNPQNPVVKVIDFGISKVGDAGGTALTRTGMIMGTPSYMSPEQARGDKVDRRADIYAVGGILYRALTGRKPFDSDDPSATLTLVLTTDPERPRAVEPSIPQALELVIQHAMAKDADERYATMAELSADLEPFDLAPTSRKSDALGGAGATLPSADSPPESVEPGAETVLLTTTSSNADLPHTHLFRATRDARLARPVIAFLTVVAYLWVLAGLVDALSGVVRLVRGLTANITRAEGVLIAAGAVAATLTPLILWVRYLARGWGNSVRALQLAAQMRRVTSVSIAVSGIGALIIRLIEGSVREQAQEVAWPVWSPVLFLASLLGGGLAFLSLKLERRK